MPRSLGKVEAPIKKLYLSEAQKNDILNIYNKNQQSDIFFTDEAAACDMVSRLGLDKASRMLPGSKWSICWGNKWADKRRILFQCGCGYDTPSRQAREKEYSTYTTVNPKSNDEWERLAPYDFTGCLAHADLTYRDGAVLRIVGYFLHDEACANAAMKRVPSIPLHPHVRELALSQLRDGASITSIEMRNIELYKKGMYKDQDSLGEYFRFQILPHDFSRLYRLHFKENGVNVSQAPEVNIDSLMDIENGSFKEDFQDAAFFYRPRTSQDDRFILCLATKEMEEATWKYCHRKQLVLDGTFGVCSSKLLLFIAMAIDNNSRGIPIAFFFFSAPSGNRATQAGYDSAVLKQVLEAWHEHLGVQNGEAFTPSVCITDTDTKERLALKSIWPKSIEILCKFHVTQCWTNKRSVLMKGKGHDLWMRYLDRQLQSLEHALLESNVYEDAVSLLMKERTFLKEMSDTYRESHEAVSAANLCVDYYDFYWLPSWISWSRKGKELAAEKMGVSIDAVLTTTNHLESFNRVLKYKYISNYQHSQIQLRFDVLMFYLVKEILPLIYSRRGVYDDLRARTISQFSDTVLKQNRSKSKSTITQSIGETDLKKGSVNLAWYETDEERNTRAKDIISQSLLDYKKFTEDEVVAICLSPSKLTGDLFSLPTLAHHLVTAHVSGVAACTCMDWRTHSGACKHLRALQMKIEGEKARGDPYYVRFHFPSSKAEALKIFENNKSRYDHYMTRQQEAFSSDVSGNDVEMSNPSDDHTEHPSLVEVASNCDSDQMNIETVEGDDNHTIEGIHRHVQGQIDYSLRHILPSLHGLLQNMKLIGGEIRDTADLQEFSILVHNFKAAMATMSITSACNETPNQILRHDFEDAMATLSITPACSELEMQNQSKSSCSCTENICTESSLDMSHYRPTHRHRKKARPSVRAPSLERRQRRQPTRKPF